MDDIISRKIEFAELFDTYSSLLTSKQREALELYFFDDLSYNEVGEVLKISKQAAYDTIKKAHKHLKEYETKISYLSMSKKIHRVQDKLFKLTESINDESKFHDEEVKKLALEYIDDITKILD